jgi:Fic family protein
MPNPDLFVAMYVWHEAVLSSQIEGTQSTLDDVLTFEVDPGADTLPLDIEVVVNYVKAMNYGLARLDSRRQETLARRYVHPPAAARDEERPR